MQNNPHYDDVMLEVSQFFQEQIEKCKNLGLSKKGLCKQRILLGN